MQHYIVLTYADLNLFTDLDVDRAINAMHFVSDMEEEGIFLDRDLTSAETSILK